MPSSWHEVSLTQYLALTKIDESYTPLKRLVYTISILGDVPLDQLYEVNFEMLTKIDLSFINKMDKTLQKIIEIEGTKYGVVKDLKSLSLGEYVDIDTYIQEPIENLHKICSIMCRPIVSEDGDLYIIEKYNPETMDLRSKLFLEKMNIADLFAISNLFLTGVSSYTEHMNHSLSQLQKKTKKMKK